MNNILLKKLEAATVKLSELDQHIELEEFLTDLVESWATDCEIKNISQEDYDYLVNLLAKVWLHRMLHLVRACSKLPPSTRSNTLNTAVLLRYSEL